MTQTLDINFEGKGEVKGFLFTQVVKGEKSYIYEVKFSNSRHYEVFKRKRINIIWKKNQHFALTIIGIIMN
mgnify:CR=1 FL=1